jgi:hypothetical protein
LQKQLDTANLTINSYKNQVEDLEKSLDTAKTAANSMALEHQREISQVCLEGKKPFRAQDVFCPLLKLNRLEK